MNYTSTRSDVSVSPSYALLHGLAADGGLYVPIEFPRHILTLEMIENKSYQDIACTVLAYFFPNFSEAELEKMVHAAYNENTFASQEIVPLHSLRAALGRYQETGSALPSCR